MIGAALPLGGDADSRQRLAGRIRLMKSAELQLADREQRATMLVTQLWDKSLRKKLLLGMTDRDASDAAARSAAKLRSQSPRLYRPKADPGVADAQHVRSAVDLRLQQVDLCSAGTPSKLAASTTAGSSPIGRLRVRPAAAADRVDSGCKWGTPQRCVDRLAAKRQTEEPALRASRPQPQTIFSRPSYGIATGDYERSRLRKKLLSYRIVSRR